MTALDERFAAVDGGDVVDAPDLSGPQMSGAGLVHWARNIVRLGDPAVCGAPEGRATRVACAVTCPACRAWMADEAWSTREQAADGPATEAAAQIAAERDQYAAEAAGLREQLAAATVLNTEQAAVIGALRAQLHAAGLNPVGQGWQQRRIGVAA